MPTTLQKFRPGEDGDRNPALTDRRNVVVVADEAHRSQYASSATPSTAAAGSKQAQPSISATRWARRRSWGLP